MDGRDVLTQRQGSVSDRQVIVTTDTYSSNDTASSLLESRMIGMNIPISLKTFPNMHHPGLALDGKEIPRAAS